MLKRIGVLALTFIITISLTACSSDKKKQAQKVFAGDVADNSGYTIKINNDGSVLYVGYDAYCNAASIMKDVIDVCEYNDCLVGLNKDGTVTVATDLTTKKIWQNIISINGSDKYLIGIRSDGGVECEASNIVEYWYDSDAEYEVRRWENIKSADAGADFCLGLKKDGTVIAYCDRNNYGQCNVRMWTDIKDIAAGKYHAVGLKDDGTVVATGNNQYGQCNVSGWTDIVNVVAGEYHTLGIKSDGTVVSTGLNDNGQCNVSEWTDIVYISASAVHTVGLKSNGEVVAVGKNSNGQCDVNKLR